LPTVGCLYPAVVPETLFVPETQVMERLKPEVVAWNKINMKAGNNPIKVMQNCNAVQP